MAADHQDDAPADQRGPHRTLQEQLEAMPVSGMQWLLWSLACAGKLFEGLIVFTGGITLPLIAATYTLSGTRLGVVSATTLLGILLGALLLGALADRFGRKPVFVGEMLVLAAALVVVGLSPGVPWLVAGLMLGGLALGADYPTAHLVISEGLPGTLRGRLVLGAFSFQALGGLLGTAVAAAALQRWPETQTWRLLYLMPAPAVLLVAVARVILPESSHWLLSQGRHQEAETQLRRLLNRPDLALLALAALEAPAPVRPPPPGVDAAGGRDRQAGWSWWRPLGAGQQRALILSAVPWFLQDITTYGVGIFTPLLLVAATDPGSQLFGARGAVLVNTAFLLGIVVAIFGSDHWGRIRLQVVGFLGCAGGLVLAAAGCGFNPGEAPHHWLLVLAGLLVFQFMANLGPNSQTYLLAGEVFPIAIRGRGAGIAAAAGKVGAVLTAFLFPLLLDHWGAARLLASLTLPCLVGALITWLFRIDTPKKEGGQAPLLVEGS